MRRNLSGVVLALVLAVSAQAQNPQLGGPMKHLLVTVDGTAVGVTIDGDPNEVMLLQNYGATYSPPADVLNGVAYNGQYGWLAGGFISLPPGSGIFVTPLDVSPALRSFEANTFAPIFGYDGSPLEWQWSGTMTHNWYAARIAGPQQATYSVYVGDAATGDPVPGFTAAEVTLSWRYDRPGDYDWATIPITPHADYQAVDGSGAGIYPVANGNPARMVGVLLNAPDDMLDATPGANPFLGGQWQVFFQATEPGDFGGTALFMGQNIGKIIGDHPNGSYTDGEWLGELDRLDADAASGHVFAPGDLVEIRARGPGLHFSGKTNINEQHSNSVFADFDVVLLQAGYGLPTPTELTLADLKNASDDFIFDSTRQTGCEHHQGTLVRLNGVSFVDTTGWGPGAALTVTDGAGRTFPVLLGLNAGFAGQTPPSGPVAITAILDQEDTDANDGLMSGYRLWVMQPGDIAGGCAGDLTGDSVVDFADFSALSAAWGTPAGDLTGDALTDFADFAVLSSSWGCGQ